jgi:hypothetical protein
MRNFENKQKIKYVSGWLKIACGVATLFYGIGLIISVFSMAFPQPPKGVTLSFIPYLIFEVIAWWNLRCFFCRSKNGQIFDATTIRRLAMAGKWSLVSSIYMIITGLVLDPRPHDFDPVWFIQQPSLLGPIAIIFAAWLLREGQTLDEEQKLTV